MGALGAIVGFGAGASACGRTRKTENVVATAESGAAAGALLGDGGRSDAPGAAVQARLSGKASAATAEAPPPQKPGMVFVAGGALRAGTPPDRTPRIAEEELPGVSLPMGGFYIDQLPYPNERGAIPTSNVTRDEAAHLCSAKGKRLCTEYEWERACKGPDNTTYEYGDAYRASVCATGVSAFQSARRPSGQRALCKSAFGAMDMHGGLWEWTESNWNRDSGGRSLSVLRGGNAEAGELAGRCANALARRTTIRSPMMGFRCCAGPKNDDPVSFESKKGVPLERSGRPATLAEPLLAFGTQKWGSDGAGAFVAGSAWTWRPVTNEELVIVSGCAHPPDAPGDKTARCGVIVARPLASDAEEAVADAGLPPPTNLMGVRTTSGASGPGLGLGLDHALALGPDGGAQSGAGDAGSGTRLRVLMTIDSGHQLSDVVQFGNPKQLRMWGVDARSAFVREFGYAYGRIEVAEPKRH